MSIPVVLSHGDRLPGTTPRRRPGLLVLMVSLAVLTISSIGLPQSASAQVCKMPPPVLVRGFHC